MFKSLRYRLLAWFLAFVLLTAALIIPANLIFQLREKSIGVVTQQIGSLHIDFLKDTKTVNDFLTVEPSNTDFFTKGDNPYLTDHIRHSSEILHGLQNIKESHHADAFRISHDLDSLSSHIENYSVLFDSLVYLVYKRGYRNFGLEGELYDYGAMLENAPGLGNRDVYRLRKAEDDYFFSYDPSSVSDFNALSRELKKSVALRPGLSPDARKRTSDLIDSYSAAFVRLVELDRLTGIRRNIALKAQLNRQGASIEAAFGSLTDKSRTIEKALIARLTWYYILSLIMIISLSLVFSYAAAKHIVSHLEALTNYISVLASNHLEKAGPIDLRNSAREIKQIYREFRNLLSQLKIWENQRDKALRKAEDNQQRYQELSDMLPQSVFETNSLGNYIYVNKAWYKAFGYTPTDLEEGLNLIETLIAESDQENILGKDRIENSTFLAVRKDGRHFPVSVYTDNIVKEGRISGRRGIIVDITDRVKYIKTLQQETSRAKTSDELKSSFLANMSHEIRTPMNSIIGFSNLLASEQIPEIQKRDFVKYIRTSSEILLNLVDDIIDIAKIEAGELKIVKKECNIVVLGEELLSTSVEIRNKFNKQHLGLSFNPPATKNVTGTNEFLLKTDPFRLRQILSNLINNAIKFTENGSVEFGFEAKDERTIEFYVKDTGVGLSRNELEVIFERFRRTRRAEEKNIVGTGLGLAISKNLVQLLGGEMWVESEPGSGTTFRFTIPYLKITRLPSAADNSYRENTGYDFTDRAILITEDDPGSMKFLKEVFQPTGARLYYACNGVEAVSLFRKIKKIDLVVMDIQLPVMDGFEATQIIKSINPCVPVLAQTAYAMSGDREKMKESGFDDYIAKPVDMNRLLATVKRYLSEAPALKGAVDNLIPQSRQRLM